MAKNYEVRINGAYHGSIVSENSGLAARSVLLNLGINEVEIITIARSENGTVHEFIYHDCFIDGYTTELVYEWKEVHTRETFHCAHCGIELTEEQLHRSSDVVTVYCVPCGDRLIAQAKEQQEKPFLAYPMTEDDIPSAELTALPIMPDVVTLENWQHDFNEWGKLAHTGSGVSLETSRVTDELELIIQCLEKNIWYDGHAGCEVRLLKLINLFARCIRKHMDSEENWQQCTVYQQDLLFVRKAFLERYCEYARYMLFTAHNQEKPVTTLA